MKLYSRRHLQYLISSSLEVVGSEKEISTYELLSENVLELVSIAQGYSIVCDKRIYENSEGSRYESYGENTGDGIGPSLIIPKSLVPQFISESYSKWVSLPMNIRSAIKTATKYVNMSTYGYLDIQLFQVFQAWELLATAIYKSYNSDNENIPIDKERRALESAVKCAYKKWEKENKEYAAKDNFPSKLLGAIKFRANRDVVEYFTDYTGLEISLLSLNMRDFRNHTNKVRHVGMLDDKAEYQAIQSLLINARFGLRLQVLKILEYEGHVVFRNASGSQCDYPISRYFDDAKSNSKRNKTMNL